MIAELDRAATMNIIKCVVPISGGKDSQCCVKLALQKFDKSEIIVTEEYIALDKKLEPIEDELFDLIKKMPLAIEKKIKGKICVIPSGLKTDEELISRVRELRKQASKIGKELDDLFFKTNPEWAKFYEYTDKI